MAERAVRAGDGGGDGSGDVDVPVESPGGVRRSASAAAGSAVHAVARHAESVPGLQGAEVPAYPAGAWRCSASSNAELVGNLEREGMVKSACVRDVLLATDRALYVPDMPGTAKRSSRYEYGPYADSPQLLGYKATVSAPHMHAMALEELAPKLTNNGGCIALDVGCGSGILLACMVRMLQCAKVESWTVTGVEVIPQLAQFAKEHLKRDGFGSLGDQLQVRHGNGWFGAADRGPFDAIHVGAAAESEPRALLEQLRIGGVLVIPLQQDRQQVWMRITRVSETAFQRAPIVGPVRYVPLVKPGLAATAELEPATSEASPTTVNYDKRYSKGWAYGKKPNAFLSAHICESASGHVVSLGEGQGRNAVYLASLGYVVSALDGSSVGLAKATLLADQQGVADKVLTHHVDLASTDALDDLPAGPLAGFICVFCPLPKHVRERLFSALFARVAPGGFFLYVGHSPSHTGSGPPNLHRASVEEVTQSTWARAARAIYASEDTVMLREGSFHRGSATLVRVVLRKEQACAYNVRMTALFKSVLLPTDEEAAHAVPCGDTMLTAAPELLRLSIKAATEFSVCKFCWVPSGACLCSQFAALQVKDATTQCLQFDVVSHPNEFLRSTSTARAACLAAQSAFRLHAYGSAACAGELHELFAEGSDEPIFMLYPTDDALSSTVLADAIATRTAPQRVLVPDGSRDNAAAVATQLQALASLHGRTIRCIALNEEVVAAGESELMSALHPGAGKGRLSTLEAVVLLLDELMETDSTTPKQRKGCARLKSQLQRANALVLAYIAATIGADRHRASEQAMKGSAVVQALADKLRSAAKAAADVDLARPGLRRCPLCGVAAATPLRMVEHVRGRQHCRVVASAVLRDTPSLGDASTGAAATTVESAASLLERYSSTLLRQATPEAPDVAFVQRFGRT